VVLNEIAENGEKSIPGVDRGLDEDAGIGGVLPWATAAADQSGFAHQPGNVAPDCVPLEQPGTHRRLTVSIWPGGPPREGTSGSLGGGVFEAPCRVQERRRRHPVTVLRLFEFPHPLLRVVVKPAQLISPLRVDPDGVSD
jgi:hypothetical protein